MPLARIVFFITVSVGAGAVILFSIESFNFRCSFSICLMLCQHWQNVQKLLLSLFVLAPARAGFYELVRITYKLRFVNLNKMDYIVIVQNIFREFTDNNFMKILLSQIMYERNLSVRQLAILSGVSKSTIQQTMKEDSNPTIRTLEKLAAGLKCKITDLFDSDFK